MQLRSGMLFSLGEENTYLVLNEFLQGKPYLIYKEVSLSQVVEVVRKELTDREWGYYTRTTLDFLVCDKDAPQRPKLAVEYDSKLHDTDKRRWNDALKNRLCMSVGLPLLRLRSELVVKRDGISFLAYMLGLHFGELAVQELIERGKLSPDEEYFPGTQFEGTTKVQHRLFGLGVVPPVYASLPQARFWYRCKTGRPCKDAQNPDAIVATTEVELLQGIEAPQIRSRTTGTAKINECSPGHDVLGVHGWFVAQELATFLAFEKLERNLRRDHSRRRGTGNA